MEQASLIDSALKVIVFNNNIENGRHPEIFKGILASGDLENAFAVAEAYHSININVSLNRAVHNPERQTLSTTYELVEAAKAVNVLRQSKGIEYLIPNEVLRHLKRTIQTFAGHKRKYDELLDQTERETRQRATAKQANDVLGREERARRRDGLKELRSIFNVSNLDLVNGSIAVRLVLVHYNVIYLNICMHNPFLV